MEVTTAMKKKKTRLIVRKGNENVVLKVEDIAFIYRDNTIIVAVDKDEKKYLCDKNLSALEEELDPGIFFRANRKHIVNLRMIEKIDTYFNGGLLLEMKGGEKIEVSRRQAVKFKEMMSL